MVGIQISSSMNSYVFYTTLESFVDEDVIDGMPLFGFWVLPCVLMDAFVSECGVHDEKIVKDACIYERMPVGVGGFAGPKATHNLRVLRGPVKSPRATIMSFDGVSCELVLQRLIESC